MDVDSQGTTVDGNCQMTGYERTGSLMKRLRLRIYGKDPSSVTLLFHPTGPGYMETRWVFTIKVG
jgi:hypothetical protein